MPALDDPARVAADVIGRPALARKKKEPRPSELDARSAHLIERRLDDLEERCSFSGDEMDAIWASVYPEGAPPPARAAEVVVGAKVRDRVRHVLKLAKKSRERAVPLADWLALTGELSGVRRDASSVVVGPRALEALGKMMLVCDLRRDLVLDLGRWAALLETVLPERYLAPALSADRPCEDPPLSEGRVACYRARHYSQRCLWHEQDAGNFDRELLPDAPPGGAGGPRGRDPGCGDGTGKRKRHARKPRTVGEKVAGGGAPPAHWHQGMLRWEDALMPAEEDYNPAKYLLADKGDADGGEGKRAHKEAS